MELSLNAAVLMLQAVVVIGGGFYFVGNLGAKMDALTTAIQGLGKVIQDHEERLRSVEVQLGAQ